MPLTAVAIATIFSSSTSSWAPSAPSSAAACARCAVGRLGRRVPDGHALARGGPACWACSGRPGRGRGSRSGRSSWHPPGRSGRAGRDAGAARSRARRGPSIWGLIPNRMTSAPSTASTLSATVRMPYSRARCSRRSGRGWLATTWPGSTSSPRSSPAIIASAITPEPTVAIVAFERGDIGRSIAAGVRVRSVRTRPVGRRRRRPCRPSGRTGRSSSTSAASKPAAAALPASSAGA